MDRIAQEAETAIAAGLARRRMQAADQRDRRVRDAHLRHQELAELDRQIAVAGTEMLLHAARDELSDAPRRKIRELEQQRLRLLDSVGLEPDYDQLQPVCARCGDTGINEGRHCSCREELRRAHLRAASRLGPLTRARFDAFDLNRFSDRPDPAAYAADVSPREQIRGIAEIGYRFARSLDQPEGKDLLLFGMPGTGKTHMAACIANDALDLGHSVQYYTAPGLFDMLDAGRMLNTSFRPDTDRLAQSERDREAVLDCRLLIVDDLGTEPLRPTTLPELLRILDHRHEAGLRTLFCTNAEPAALRGAYDERLCSRLIGRSRLLRFFGTDLRIATRRAAGQTE